MQPCIAVPFLFIFSGCVPNNREAENTGGDNPADLYFDYHIWSNEENGNITLRLQCLMGSPEGKAVLLPVSAKVEIDGEELQPDSSKMSGAWYEIIKPAKEFEGRHLIKYTDENKNEYSDEFVFRLIKLVSEVPSAIKRSNIVFELEGLNAEDWVQVLLTDTAYNSHGMDRVDTVRNGLVYISTYDLDNVRNGPVAIEFYKDEVWPLKGTGKKGGRMIISYEIKKVFELTD